MAHSLSITLESVCSGGNHATIGYVLDGGAKVIRTYLVDDVRAALTADDIETLRFLLVRATVAGLGAAAAKTKLQAGATVNLP